MASTIHRNPADCYDHAMKIAVEQGKTVTVFYSIPSAKFAVLPHELALRMAAGPGVALIVTVGPRDDAPGETWEQFHGEDAEALILAGKDAR